MFYVEHELSESMFEPVVALFVAHAEMLSTR